MSGYDPARYGDQVGDYDALYPGTESETAAAVRLLRDLTESHPVARLLEFGIGTGRLAVPVSRRGVEVVGIDGSERMVKQLHDKLGNDERIPVVIGDYIDATAPGTFSTVVLPLNAIFDPRGTQAQLDIIGNAARHLAPGGALVIETWVMSDRQRDGAWSIVPRYVGDHHIELQLARFDIDTNTIERTLVHLRPEGTDFVTVTDTYASPGELDVMARVNGFTRSARYANWDKQPFTATSSASISVYTKD